MNEHQEGHTRKDFLKTGAAAAGAAMVATMGFNRIAEAEDTSEMITQTAEFKMSLDHEEEALEILSGMVAGVEANEPDVLAYICHRGVDDPSQIYFFEVYKNKAALDGHGRQPHMAKMGPAFGKGVFAGPLNLVKYDRIKGFAR